MYETLIAALRKVDEYDSGYAKLMYDAADAIEVLSKMEKATRWIPVTERLPDIGTYIVAGKMKYSFEENYEHFVDVASYGFWDDGKEESWLTFNDWYEGQQEYEITHWMLLPEPPKEES